MGSKLWTISVIVAGTSMASPAALGQDALGSGNALDANLSTQGRGNISAPVTDFRARNNIVTDNVIGGRGFRGSVGYAAPGDFRGNLGSNDLYQFRASSALSSPEFFRAGTTAQQLQFGGDLAEFEYRRAGAAAINDGYVRVPQFSESYEAGLRLDRSALRSATGLRTAELSQPRVLGVAYTQEGLPLIYGASAARGVTVDRADQFVAGYGLTPLDTARLLSDLEAGRTVPVIGRNFETPLGTQAPVLPGAPQEQPEQVDSPQRVQANVETDYVRILQRISDRYAGLSADRQPTGSEPAADLTLTQRYQQLRQQLAMRSMGLRDDVQPATQENVRRFGEASTTQQTGQPAAGDDSPIQPGEAALPQPGQRRPGFLTDRPDLPVIVPDRAEAEKTITDFGIVLQHGERIQALATPGTDRFSEIMALAEQSLRRGEFFDAERRFERALRFTPGHPLATVGSAHSQLGAGLYLSAALTLRQLFTRQPEMIDATYETGLMPPQVRLQAAITVLRSRLEPSNPDRASYGLLLAYIGKQQGDRGMMSEGLDAMSESRRDRDLLELLRAVWLRGQTMQQPSASMPEK